MPRVVGDEEVSVVWKGGLDGPAGVPGDDDDGPGPRSERSRHHRAENGSVPKWLEQFVAAIARRRAGRQDDGGMRRDG